MAPPPHLKLTLPRAPPSTYTGSSYTGSSSSSASVLDCDVPIPSIEHVDAADRTANWVVQSSGSRAGSPGNPPRLSGSPAFTETSAPDRESSASRSRSLSDDHGSSRSSPSVVLISATSNPDGESEIKREAPGGSIWSASPRPPARRSSVSGRSEPAPSQSPSVSGSGVLYPSSSGSKRSRDAEDDGGGERSSQRRRRSTSPGLSSRRSSAASLPGDASNPAPSQSPSVSGSRTLGSTPSGCKRSRDVEDDGAGDRSPQRRRTGGFLEVVLATYPPEPVVTPSDSAVDAAGTTDPAGLVDLVAAPAQPVALVVVDAVNIVDIEPVVGPAAAVANPGPLPDRAETRVQARLDALFAKSRGRPRAERSALHRSLESWLSREELLLDLQAGKHA
ncbi:hypothetical protein GMDG_05130 [Pseudogymnoascus destructans 20631-21]|uniref:Uncharacterized protein n=1 Tax=Pseudogymnoascus destructans (strain ATCC MYA-4855 / 20631-21) TaxID=658429 RepID=L8FM01_PSED2|nr:hypothetical protein GMDG_05130 [Pseudogymnoascus destructans 20631-21]